MTASVTIFQCFTIYNANFPNNIKFRQSLFKIVQNKPNFFIGHKAIISVSENVIIISDFTKLARPLQCNIFTQNLEA